VTSKRTVSDSKRAFFAAYPRPVNSIYRRVIDELLVEVHLLITNQDFRYDPLFATGLLTAYQVLMEGYTPVEQRDAILRAFCTALELSYDQLHADAAQWRAIAAELPAQEVFEVMAGKREAGDGRLKAVSDTLTGIAGAERFKYSRLFSLGLANILEQVGRAAAMSEKDRLERLQQICTYLALDYNRVKRDLDFFHAVLERIKRSKEVVDELSQTERRKREERAVSQPG
jgi:photosystem II biogenesis protein Psp29